MASLTNNTGSTGAVLLGMGNPLLDISANVPQSVLDKYGVKVDNAILAEEQHLPLFKELVDNYSVDYIAGGATQNSIRVAQWMLQRKNMTAYAGCVGKDQFAADMTAACAVDGVATHYLENAETPTGTCAVLIKENERSLVANLSAANKYDASHLETEEMKAVLNDAKYIYIAGFFLTVSPAAIQTVGKHAAENNKVFLMNLSAPFLITVFKQAMDEALPFTDFVFGNEVEAATFGESRGWGKDLKEIALKLSQLPKASGARPRVVVFTQGADATIVAANGKVTVYEVTKIPKEQLVDTNGAGDAFVGGFLSQLVDEKSLDECVRAGHYAAGVIVQRSGCTYPDTPSF